MAEQSVFNREVSFRETPISKREDGELMRVQRSLVEQIEDAKKNGLHRQLGEATTQLRRVSLELLARNGRYEDIPVHVSHQVRVQSVFEAMAKTHLDAYGVTPEHEDWGPKVQEFGEATRIAAANLSSL